MATKRTAHTFGDEVKTLSEPRERPAPSSHQPLAVKAAGPAVSSGDSILPGDMEPPAVWAGNSTTASSRDSFSSSTNSSTLSTPSDVIFNNTAIPSLLPESMLPDPNFDAITAVQAGAPINFGTILPGLYRSSYPKPENYDFLRQLGLKTIVTLVDKNFTDGYGQFMAENRIQHHMFSMKGTKKEEIPLATMQGILTLVLDRRNYPLLIHCNHGKHRTGCVAAVVRKLTGWDTAIITDEYKAYAGRKVRDCDVRYIRSFSLTSVAAILANQDLDVRDLCDKAGVNGVGVPVGPLDPGNAAAFGFRVPSFFRATFFSMTVLFIWMLSGFKMSPSSRR